MAPVIGNIVKKGDKDVEWRIPDYFSYSVVNNNYHSSNFTISGYTWYFSINPASRTDRNADGCISLYLGKVHTSAIGAIYRFGIQKKDGNVEKNYQDFCWLFNTDIMYGTHTFYKMSDLIQQKSELVPSDVLTITCSVLVCENIDSTPEKNSLSNDLLHMYISEKGCDVNLNVKGKRFSAHKFILVARCPVFATMLEIPMKEQATGIIDIEDCDPEPFEDFLKYLYSGRVEQLSTHVFELYKISHKYGVVELKSACAIAIMNILSEENFCDVSIFADTYDDIALKERVQFYFNEHFGKIFFTVPWVNLLAHNHLLASDMLKKLAISLKKKLTSSEHFLHKFLLLCNMLNVSDPSFNC